MKEKTKLNNLSLLSNFPIHSFVIAIYPILYIYSRNLVNFSFRDILRFLLISAFFFVFLLICFRLILKDWGKSGILSSLIAFLFYSFGHAANAIENVLYPRGLEFSISVLAAGWLILFLALAYFTVNKPVSENNTLFFNVVSILLISFTLFSILIVGDINKELSPDEIQTLSQLRGEKAAEASLQPIPASEMPDIYYIILDGYLRTDYLKGYFDYDNAGFSSDLEQRGFYILQSSRSNYLNTNYSLNTALNLVYFHQYPRRIFNKSKYNLHTSYLHDFLHRNGYQTVVFDSGSRDTNEQPADIFLSLEDISDDDKSALNKFEQFFLMTTLARLLFTNQTQIYAPDQPTDLITDTVNQELSLRRERISYAFDHLPDYASMEGNYFLFSHIYLPHIPFLYGPGGDELRYHSDQNLYWYEVPQEDYAEYYGYQIDYLNTAILKTVDDILAGSHRPVVIILQADHGDELYLDRDHPTTEGIEVRSAILNAIYFSDGEYDDLYPSMTPVNTFRVILNHWFGTQYEILPDQVFFHEDTLSTRINEKPDFLDSCEHFQLCMPPPPD